MATKSRVTYQFDGGLEKALIDVCAVAITGNVGGVRQLAARILRAIPPEVLDAERFRDQITSALANSGGTNPRLASRPPTDRDSRIDLVDVQPAPSGTALVVPSDVRSEFDAVIAEWSARKALADVGVSPTLTLLLTGPPGVGKTHSARWLAEQMKLPLLAADLAGLVSSYLGNTGRNLRRVLEFATEQPCVLLLDEFDALAKRRDDDSDVGELKRIVNVLLLELERWPAHCLLVAATNHPQLLDQAVERRFDRTIDIPLPGPHERVELFRQFSDGVDVLSDEVLSGAAALAGNVTGSQIQRLVSSAARRAVVDGTPLADALMARLFESFEPDKIDRAEFCRSAHEVFGMTHRQIAKLLGVSHPTVGTAIRSARQSQ